MATINNTKSVTSTKGEDQIIFCGLPFSYKGKKAKKVGNSFVLDITKG